jgi:PadR family transcriptional regulator PadR
MTEPTPPRPAPADNWEAQLRKGPLELAILASLWAEPLYGLEILAILRDRGGMDVAAGTLYPILNRLRVDELVTSEWRDAGTVHPRKYYTLTDAGRLKTRAMARTWNAFAQQIDGLLSTARLTGEPHDDAR